MPALVVAGLQKTSLIDFPGRVSCVVFLTGCNFSCPYCHNPELARGHFPERISMPDLNVFLARRRTLLDGVVISGGEPTLWPDLDGLCRAVRDLGLAVKLDTNGSRPEVLQALMRANLVDYIAMDLKTAPEHYGPPLCGRDAGTAVLKSIKTVMTGGVDYEFRTTCVAPFVDEARIHAMALAIKGARRFILQTFNPSKTLDPGYGLAAHPGLSNKQMQSLQKLATPLVQTCTIR
jgi:pyruvate formate lyase activating enzyme